MNIEKDELFAITRGFELDHSFDSILDAFEGVATQARTQNWDRSHEGCIYKALEVCGPLISAECIFFDKDSPGYSRVGKKLSINTNEVEVWPVTKAYLTSLQVK